MSNTITGTYRDASGITLTLKELPQGNAEGDLIVLGETVAVSVHYHHVLGTNEFMHQLRMWGSKDDPNFFIAYVGRSTTPNFDSIEFCGGITQQLGGTSTTLMPSEFTLEKQ